MKICPIAIAVGCEKCPAFKVCPAKASLGGYVAPEKSASVKQSGPSKAAKKK